MPDYFFIFTKLSFFSNWVKVTQRVAGQPNINAEEYSNLPIPFPSLEIQQKIVDIYQDASTTRIIKIDESGRLLNSINALILKELEVTLCKEGKQKEFKVRLDDIIGTRFDVYYHQPHFAQSYEQLMNSRYSIYSLKEISNIITSGQTPTAGGNDYTNSKDGVAFIRSGDIDINGNIDFDNLLYITHKVHNTKMKSSQLLRNDIMIAIVGATIGQVGIYLSDKEANINQAIALVRLKDGISPEYIKEVLKSSIGQLSLDRLKRPVARANINLDEVGSILVPVPSIDKQNEIVNRIKQIRLRAKQLQEEGDRILEETKQKIEQLLLG